jgi:hypothetical protein
VPRRPSAEEGVGIEERLFDHETGAEVAAGSWLVERWGGEGGLGHLALAEQETERVERIGGPEVAALEPDRREHPLERLKGSGGALVSLGRGDAVGVGGPAGPF